MARSNCRCGTDPENIQTANGACEAAEAKQPSYMRRTGMRYLYMAGALAVVALLIMLAAV
jgi:nitroreductase